LEEAGALERLRHRAIIGIRDCNYADKASHRRPYLIMEFFEGLTLQAYVDKHGPIPLNHLIPLAKTLAEALQAAHGKKLLHRDVKPANVMVRREGGAWDVKLIDFGLALKASALNEASLSTAR